MASTRTERRLAAILAADVVGYSRLVEQDEEGTLAALRDIRHAVVDPLLAEHRGRIVKLMGDGLLAEFGSVVDAVACALAIQAETAARQDDILPERRIMFRIGINLGDVVVEGEDLLGDGVNIAARLEQLCTPGGVMVSGTAYDHLKGKLNVPFDFAGQKRVKNISQPVRTYTLRMAGVQRGWSWRTRLVRRWHPRSHSCGGVARHGARPLVVVSKGRVHHRQAHRRREPYRQALDRRAAVRQSRRRRCDGASGGRGDRGHHHGSVPLP